MFKKYRLIVALLVVGLLSGSFLHTVDASASVGNNDTKWSHNSSHKQYSKEWQHFIKKCFERWNVQWDFNDQVKDPVDKEDSNQEVDKDNSQTEDNNQENQDNNQENQDNNQANQNNSQGNQQGEQNNQSDNNANDSNFLNEFEQQVVDLTNQERAKYGLNPLKADYELSRVAQEKSRDMLVNNYFDHNSPVYGSPFDMMDAFKITYRAAGENIAKGQRSPQEVVNADRKSV